jgi:hypothetical protein
MKHGRFGDLETSGWRDLNPRPVAAATVLPMQYIQLIPTPTGLEVPLFFHCLSANDKGFAMLQSPRDSMASCL